ncbi:hypothetical protein DPMN_118580 [Dreissena polymorpha]|uniref:Secreted protein n=1 Tax=Dreissena polymorpha TaxID=45954 RepID=A0A9D4GNC9_DREPO|nr:hypothetical protein DPMN_118580 [Dreissena polymorpha]
MYCCKGVSVAFCHGLLFTAYITAGKFTSCYNAAKAKSHYDAGGAPVRDQESTWMNRGPTGMNRCSTGMNCGQPGLYRESITMLNTSGMNRGSPGTTGNDRRGTGNNRNCTGNNRDGTVAPPGPKINRPWQSYGEPGECRQSPGISTVHK